MINAIDIYHSTFVILEIYTLCEMQTLTDSEGQGNLASFYSWGRRELDMTEWLNNSNKKMEM